ncbi:Uncharacterized protein QTN25_008124 [Entamoeba marina]
MEYLTNLPNTTNAFTNFIPTTLKKPANYCVNDSFPNPIENNETHVLLTHLDNLEQPRKRLPPIEPPTVTIRRSNAVTSVQMDLID